MTLLDIWQEHQNTKKKSQKLKVRFEDWNHRWRYFVVVSYDEARMMFVGVLDNNEKVEYSASSTFWKEYEEGDELSARAV